MPVTNAKNLSLQKKSAARIAAIQIIYKLTVNKDLLDPAKQIAALRVQFFKNPEEQRAMLGAAVEPNYTLLDTILSGICTSKKEIDTMLNSALTKDWKRERMSVLLVAILQVAIAELFVAKDINLKIAQDEYSKITRSFFGEAEVKFVFAALANLAEKYE